ncbi:MAG: BatD family protein [Sulfurovaceae bacterium]
MMQNLGKIFIFFILFVNISYANVSIDMTSNKKSLYYGDSLVVSVIISKKADIDISSTKYIKPPFDGFIFKEISKKSIRRGVYDIVQIDYLLTPQKPGNYIIDPAKVTITAKKSTLRSFFDTLFGRKPQTQTISSKMLSVTIKPLPSLVQLVGDFNISVKPNLMTTDINAPVVLSLKVEGEGAIENFDGLDYDIDGLTVNAQNPKITQEIRGDKIYSSYIKEYIFVSDHDFTIPSRSITMYNTNTNKIETIIMPSYDIEVIGSPSSSTNNDSSKDGIQSIFWLIISFIAGLFSMILLLLVMSRKRKKSNKK